MLREKERKVRFDERHWTEKPLSEMADRDWRIFREDYNISTKGGRIPHPLRSWSEAGLGAEIMDVIDSLHYTVSVPLSVCLVASGGLAHRSRLQYRDRPFQLAYRTEISLA